MHDDGTLAPFAPPGWSSLHAFRAQPGRDGELPDLAVSVSAAPGEVCEEPTKLVTIAVRNVGSAEAPAGAVVRLSSWDGAARTVLLETTLAAAISPGERVVVDWEGPLDVLGLVVEIEPVGAECDSLDDVAELLPL